MPTLKPQASSLKPRGRRGRAGITLLEVLISMFVLLVGLLGVASLIPVGKFEMQRGAKIDRASACGRAAMRDVKTRGMMNPRNWSDVNGMDGMDSAGLINSSGTYVAFRAFAIDPLGVGDPAASTSLGSRFPFASTSETSPPLIPRMSLFPNTLLDPPPSTYTPAQLNAMRVALADSIFRCQDDLAFDVPSDEDQLPSQILQGGTRRLSQGDYSWLMTVVPDPDLVDPASPFAQPMRVSVAVFFKRPIGIVGGGERICDVSYPGGSDGEVELQLPSAKIGPQYGSDGAAHLDVKSGQWIMLAGTKTVAGSPRWDFHWHRIVSADQTTDGGGNAVTPGTPGTGPWKKRLTLAGPDWSAAYSGGRAFLFDGIVNVYEKTLKLETESMY